MASYSVPFACPSLQWLAGQSPKKKKHGKIIELNGGFHYHVCRSVLMQVIICRISLKGGKVFSQIQLDGIAMC